MKHTKVNSNATLNTQHRQNTQQSTAGSNILPTQTLLSQGGDAQTDLSTNCQSRARLGLGQNLQTELERQFSIREGAPFHHQRHSSNNPTASNNDISFADLRCKYEKGGMDISPRQGTMSHTNITTLIQY